MSHTSIQLGKLLGCFLLCSLGSSVVGTPFVPNDPYFFTNTPAGYPGQWHLDKQTSGALVDVNVRGAWERGLTGQGVTIGVVESAFEYTHPDLALNYSAEHSWDFKENDADPYPSGEFDVRLRSHPTSVAGVAAARGGNGMGVTGAAPRASLASLAVNRFPDTIVEAYTPSDDALFANANLHHAAPDGSGVNIFTHSYHPTHGFGYVQWPVLEDAVRVSNQAGAINVWMAGNWRNQLGSFHDFDRDGFFSEGDHWISADAGTYTVLNLPETIVVAALGSDAKFSGYSNYGPNVFVASLTNSGAAYAPPQPTFITTTDQSGTNGYNKADDAFDYFPDLDYTSYFSGTSSATPLVAGVLALAKEAQPGLDTRFAKHLLARTSRLVDPDDATPMGGWTTNAAGLHFNHNYGFGLIDADALTAAATRYTGVTPLRTAETGDVAVALALPEDDDNGLSQAFSVTETGQLEEVQIHLDLDTGGPGIGWASRGDVEAILRSPSGTESIFLYRNRLDNNPSTTGSPALRYLDWTFTTNVFWGEEAAGEWTLTLRDVALEGRDQEDYFPAMWNSFAVTARIGELIPVTTLVGDFDGDGDVDGRDFLVWQQGDSPNPISADDLADWHANYGTTSTNASVVVPEPPDMLLLITSLAVIFCNSRLIKHSEAMGSTFLSG